MSKLNLIALIIISSMLTGYRRAGFVLEQGENRLTDVNETQYHLLNDDPNLAVSVDEQAGEQVDDVNPVKLAKTTAPKKPPLKPTPDKKATVKKAPVKESTAK